MEAGAKKALRASLYLALISALWPLCSPTANAADVTMTVDASQSIGSLAPLWRFFGADEPNYVTAPAGKKLLTELGTLRHGAMYFRSHHLLTSGDGSADFKWGSTNIYTEKDGKGVYDFRIVDGIIDTLVKRGIHPYLEIGFMPEALTSAPADVPYRRPWRPGEDHKGITAGWSYPPSNLEKWSDLVYRWTAHNLKRYGREEVEKWYFEVWNEPNLDFYWSGTPERFYQLHDYAIEGVRRALPTARVGGPDVAGAGGTFLDDFLRHVTTGKNYATGRIGTPTDFVSFHAKGQPTIVQGRVRMGISNQLLTIDKAFATISAIPQFKHTPVVIGENDPEGCAACPGAANAYRNGSLYSSYTAASYARIWELARKYDVDLQGAITWAFTFPDQRWFAGFRQLSTNGVDLPVLNVFRLLARLGPDQLLATSSGQTPLEEIVAHGVAESADVGILASRSKSGRVDLLLWNYQDDDIAGTPASVDIAVTHVTRGVARHARAWRVGPDASNAFQAWQMMGSPPDPTPRQQEIIKGRAQLSPESIQLLRQDPGGAFSLHRSLPSQTVELIEFDSR